MQVEAEIRLEPAVHGLERLRFGRREPARVAIDVDPHRILPLKALGPIGIEHRDHHDGERTRHAVAHGAVAAGGHPRQDVGERHRRRRLVAVHL